MSTLRYILASLVHHRRVHLAVAAGVAVATAVIVGALLVGDSVRGSLQNLALGRLGRIEAVLVGVHPFRVALADEFQQRAAELSESVDVAPAILTRGTLKTTDDDEARLAAGVSVIACDHRFWEFESEQAEVKLSRREIAITQRLADELHAEVDDQLLLRIPAFATLPGDSTLAEKEDTIVSRRFTVSAILPDDGLARFSLEPTQRSPRNVFLSLSAAQAMLDWDEQANAIVVSPAPESKGSSDQFWQRLTDTPLKPTLDDLGLQLEQVTLADGEPSARWQISSRSMVLPDIVVEIIEEDYGKENTQRVVTYLANTLESGEKKIPYSTITGVDSRSEAGPLLDDKGQPIAIAPGEIVLNDWAATDLDAKPGDEIVVTYYEPETTHGELQEAPPLKLKLKAVVPLARAEGSATVAADPTLTPELPGVTDQASISDWDLPFELVEEIRPHDEDYWDEYRTTPKAFVALETAQQLWHTRWGTDSAVRLPPNSSSETSAQLADKLDPAQLGLTWLPLRIQGLLASRGTTSFEGLFLGFSFFLLASAMLLMNLLFKLGIEGRTAEVGLLTAIGFPASKLRRLLLGETAMVAIAGAAVGVLLGIAYARLMIHGLSTWWVAATVEPFLSLYVSPRSLILGFLIGVLISVATTAWSLRKVIHLPARQLIAGDSNEPVGPGKSGKSKRRLLPAALMAIAVLLVYFARNLTGEAQAGAFFTAGALVLTASLWQLGRQLRGSGHQQLGSLSLSGLAARNARRNPSRSILSVSLAAVASFLIVALSAFRLAPTEQGTGGFDLLATCDQPLLFDLNTSAGREKFGFDKADESIFAGVQVESLRVHDGADASCLNLYQTTQPRVLGVSNEISNSASFAFAASFANDQNSSPWDALSQELGVDTTGRQIVPVVLDKNTATYSLHLSGLGAQFTINDGFDQQVTLEVVGLLAGSILQGNVVMSESNFLRLYPTTTGHRFFLIRAGDNSVRNLANRLETQLEDFGFEAVDAKARLADFLAVQNTYLSTFQTLGALGLLLGTVGLAIAQLRSVLERRSELAVLRAAGFRRQRLANMVLGENLVLLLGGLGIGCLAATVAVLPHWWLGEASTPWVTLAAMLLAIALAGVLAGLLAVRAAVEAPLVAALRGE